MRWLTAWQMFNHIAFYKSNPQRLVLKTFDHSLEGFIGLKTLLTMVKSLHCMASSGLFLYYECIKDYTAYLSFTGNIAGILQTGEISSYFRCSVTKL